MWLLSFTDFDDADATATLPASIKEDWKMLKEGFENNFGE